MPRASLRPMGAIKTDVTNEISSTMKVIFTNISLALLVIALPQVALSDSSEEDTKAVRDLEKRQEEAWNRHDPKAYASLFSEDGDSVNVVGWWWKGRAESEKKRTAAYSYVFQERGRASTA